MIDKKELSPAELIDKKRQELETEIEKAVTAFSEETGATVKKLDIGITAGSRPPGNTLKYTAYVDLEITRRH